MTERRKELKEQFYKAYEYYQYPDVVHVKKDSYHSDVVCLKQFGSAYMEVVSKPEEGETETFVKLSSFVKFASRLLGQKIDNVREEMRNMGYRFPGEYSDFAESKYVDALHCAIGTLIMAESEIQKNGMAKLKQED